jgi:peptidoglycan/LPS O-acetylase OafA/YrhL
VVVVYHAALFGFKLPGRVDRFGWIGVDLFFVLSGYLIGGQLLAALARDERIKLGQFFTRRVLRIMPAYFVVLAIYFLLPPWREYSEMSQPLWKFLLSVQNIALHGGTAFSHAWSLAVEDQFYLALPFLLLFLYRRPRAAIIIPCLIVIGGLALRAFLAARNSSVDGTGVSFRGFQAWIYYPTWTRLDPLVWGVALAAIDKFRPTWWKHIINCGPWLLLPAIGLIAYALYLGETENLSVTACVWQFPLIAIGMAALLVCAVSPRLPFCRVAIPGAAFIASIAYSAYLIQKLVINAVEQFCTNHNIDLTSMPALLGVELCVYAAATVLFLSIERPFLLLRRRLAPRRSARHPVPS